MDVSIGCDSKNSDDTSARSDWVDNSFVWLFNTGILRKKGVIKKKGKWFGQTEIEIPVETLSLYKDYLKMFHAKHSFDPESLAIAQIIRDRGIESEESLVNVGVTLKACFQLDKKL